MKKYIIFSLYLLQSTAICLGQITGQTKSDASSLTPITLKTGTTKHGPEKGSLLIIGGNEDTTAAVWNKFAELAGGKEKAVIVVVTTAVGFFAPLDQLDIDMVKKGTGIQNVTLLHTTDFKEANSEKFIAPLKKATGIYFTGGRQWRLADSYLNTLTHKAFQEVLDRGGVIAGSSAGASIQGSFLWRGDTSGADILVGDHTQGLGFLKNSAIDQHLLKRNRQFDLVSLIQKSPELIGIGLDEATAVVVQKDVLQVIGDSFVSIYDYKTITGNTNRHLANGKEDFTASSGPFFFLKSGQKYDLAKRLVIRETSTPSKVKKSVKK